MEWGTMAILVIVLALVMIALVRTVRRRRLAVLVLWLLLGVLLVRWAGYRGAWPELLLATGGALAITVGWWLIHGRTLPPPDDSIRVWSKDDPF